MNAAPDPSAASAVSLLRMIADVAERWRLLASLGLLGALVAAVWSLVMRPTYRAWATFTPEEIQMPGGTGGLAALAGQLGGLPDVGRSLEFYAQLLRGPTLLGHLATDSFPSPDQPATHAQLLDILDIRGESEAERLDEGVEFLLEDALETSIDDQSGTVTFGFGLPSPDLAAQVAQRAFQLLVRYNLETRNSSATERRRFAERELERTRTELIDAEAELRAFLEANRNGLESPRLAMRRRQLQRNVDVLTAVHSQLATEVQQSRLDEVRDTPTLTMVEEPRPPVRRESPRRVRMTLIGGVLGTAAGVVWIVLSGIARQMGELDPTTVSRLRWPMRRRQA